MFAGFLFSRVVLSIAMILLGATALLKVSPRRWLDEKWWCWGVVWLALFAITYFWSDDRSYWLEHVQVKLPILLLPLAFGLLPAFRHIHLRYFTVALSICLYIGIGYSMYFLFTETARYVEGYRFSNVLPTLPKDEHIRFTLALSLGLVWCVYYYPFIDNRWLKRWVVGSIIIFGIAIHIYAVRTGLLAFYLFIFMYLVYLFINRKTRRYAIVTLIVMAVSTYAAFRLIPTLENRVNHFKWSIKVFEEGELNPNYGDIGRYISYKIAADIIREHPISGVGVGDIFSKMKEKYELEYPQVTEAQQLVPHNQFLLIAAAAGIPAAIAFCIWLCYPLMEIKRNRNGYFFLMTWVLLLIPLMVEPVLEVQFGVFVYLFFFLWQRHTMLHPPQSNAPY